ncbi:hypothetical protein M885DRAFT_520489 [Pelagophyceae sp. CCMP2097]|nr:hypothetical protein M885DRAFT_520489 [Pelagophyceae sp. CCMP2097]
MASQVEARVVEASHVRPVEPEAPQPRAGGDNAHLKSPTQHRLVLPSVPPLTVDADDAEGVVYVRRQEQTATSGLDVDDAAAVTRRLSVSRASLGPRAGARLAAAHAASPADDRRSPSKFFEDDHSTPRKSLSSEPTTPATPHLHTTFDDYMRAKGITTSEQGWRRRVSKRQSGRSVDALYETTAASAGATGDDDDVCSGTMNLFFDAVEPGDAPTPLRQRSYENFVPGLGCADGLVSVKSDDDDFQAGCFGGDLLTGLFGPAGR